MMDDLYDEFDVEFTSWDEWAGWCGQGTCDNPIDFDNCSQLIIGADAGGNPIMLLVCTTCAYQHRLEMEME